MPIESPTPTGTPSPTPTSTSPTGQTVTIPLDQLNAFTSMQARLASIEETHQREATEAARRESEALAKKGELESALQQLRQQSDQAVAAERSKLTATEERAKRYALDGELARTLSSLPLVQGGAEQLTQLWRNQFQVQAEGESFAVRTPTFQTVGQFVADQLAKAEYAHFLRAQNTGGTAGSTGGHQAAPTPPAQPGSNQPATLGEAVILHMQNMKKEAGDPRLNTSLPFGLRAAK
jgi:hypothetical protein